MWVFVFSSFLVDYIVEYDYDAVHDDELTIRVGEIIRNVKKLEEEGWLEGELNGRRGMFPDNFVKVSFFVLPWFYCHTADFWFFKWSEYTSVVFFTRCFVFLTGRSLRR